MGNSVENELGINEVALTPSPSAIEMAPISSLFLATYLHDLPVLTFS